MPLRPELFNRLKYRFGYVSVACEGEAMSARVITKQGKQVLEVMHPGEYYRVSCPFCNDTRKRLWINHMWGHLHPTTNTRNLFLAICYNENCLANYENRKWLFREVYNDFDDATDRVIRGEHDTKSGTFVWPGEILFLDQLPKDHFANNYLRARGFDPSFISNMFAVGLCVRAEPQYSVANDRLIIPVVKDGVLGGWQARIPRELSIYEKGIVSKYYSMPTWKKSQFLYNYDVAKNYPFVVITEGPTDVWRFGPEAIAIFGKKISTPQAMLLGNWQNVVLLLDGDVDEDQDIQGNIDLMKTYAKNTKVNVIRLPGKCDPGDMETDVLRSIVIGVK